MAISLRAELAIDVFAAPPFCWPPEIVRRQRIGDLRRVGKRTGAIKFERSSP